jgi:uncharacterized protein YjaZ
MSRSKASLIGLNFLPARVWYVPDKEAWLRLRKRYKLDPDVPFPDTDGSCTYIENVSEGQGAYPDFILLTIHRTNRRKDLSQVAGIIAHECMHAWRYIRIAMHETEPSLEFEAYVMHYLVQQVTRRHLSATKKPWRRHA